MKRDYVLKYRFDELVKRVLVLEKLSDLHDLQISQYQNQSSEEE